MLCPTRRALWVGRAARIEYRVTRVLREALLDLFPGARGEDRRAVFYRRFLQFLLFSVPDGETGWHAVPHELLLEWFGVPSHRHDHGVRTGDLLAAFSRDVLELKVTGWDHRVCECRRVRPL